MKDFGGFWKEKWRQVGIRMASKIDANFERPFFQKALFFLGKTMILKVLEIEVGSKNQSKIDQKLKPKMDGLLASIVDGFWFPSSTSRTFKIMVYGFP